MAPFRDLSDVAAHLSGLDLPFTWYVMGPEDGAIALDVAPKECDTAVRYFAQHPVQLEDGTPVGVSVKPRRGGSRHSPPDEGVAGPTEAFDQSSLIGLDVGEAARLASAAGWIVRAVEAEAVITADRNPNRLNLSYGDDEVVESVHTG